MRRSQDLNVTRLSTATLRPSEPTERRYMFLSNIDQVLNFSVETVHFFNANAEHPIESVIATLRSAVERVLVPYDFLAGRLRLDESKGRLEIDCNAAGVTFVVAKCNIIQMRRLAALAFNRPLPFPPLNDRRLLAARSPPRVTFSHPEFLKLETLPTPHTTMLDPLEETLEFKLFHLDTNNISTLKEKAKMNRGEELDPRAVTSFNVVIAHLWRCKALATNEAHDVNKVSTVLYAVDIRRRFDPPLPVSYTGNAVSSAYARATCYELANSSLSRIVGMVREGATRMTDEYIRSVIDWGELYKGFPYGDVFVTSWWKLGFAEVEYPWGKPIYSCPVTHPCRDIVLLFPRIEGADKGVNVLISLPKGDMEKFERLFYKLLDEM
ncbi:uncharacterized protein A4U43_C04F19660 [Asparagus officinalis]|uniref:Omega-hydroxypalmitate O-feruloyl transferase n=1 Tax=Asparagus officinalis TaxID=4686 RepID=A0A5P1F6W2_ASPOF|nr:uncharacterized protein A4U43_C04F19660 [Asparagus officinalis]